MLVDLFYKRCLRALLIMYLAAPTAVFADVTTESVELPTPTYFTEIANGIGPFIAPIEVSNDRPLTELNVCSIFRVTNGTGSQSQTRPRICCRIQAASGTPVMAMADGVVLKTGWYGGYGKVVILSHGNDYSTMYAHLVECTVSQGQEVKQGQVIAAVGSTGFSTGSKLFFQIRKQGKILSNTDSIRNVILSKAGESI